MMIRLLFWVALAVLVLMALRSKVRGMAAPPSQAPHHPDSASEQRETMVACAHCHLYFPASESVRADGLDYCSPAHVRLPAK
ncbi:MAG: PP0621 family protein [Massilia sp.]